MELLSLPVILNILVLIILQQRLINRLCNALRISIYIGDRLICTKVLFICKNNGALCNLIALYFIRMRTIYY